MYYEVFVRSGAWVISCARLLKENTRFSDKDKTRSAMFCKRQSSLLWQKTRVKKLPEALYKPSGSFRIQK